MDDRYQTFIPVAAVKPAISFHKDGSIAVAEYLLDGALIGRRHWDPAGFLTLATPLRRYRKHGLESHWYFQGILTAAEPDQDGPPHGAAWQWSEEGCLIGTHGMDRGTGLDLWWDHGADGFSIGRTLAW